MKTQLGPLRLAGQEPVANGKWRFVFQHPHEDGLLVKVLNREGKIRQSRNSWFKAKPREGDFLLFGRELHEYIVAEANANGRPNPIPRILGLVETDLGLGLVVEKLSDREGKLAPTLLQRLEPTGLTLRYEKMLATLIADINQRRIVLTEFQLRNIVCVENGEDQDRLVLVDGFGDSSLIPLHSLSRFANAQRNLRKYRKLVRKTKRDLPAR